MSIRIATLGRTALSLHEFALQSDVRPRAGDGTSMFVALWEFEVKPRSKKRFQKVYGPGGDWAKLFRSDSHYQETPLLHDPEHPARFQFLDLAAGVREFQGIACRRIRKTRRGGRGRLDGLSAWGTDKARWELASGENRTGERLTQPKPAEEAGVTSQNSRREKICCQATFR